MSICRQCNITILDDTEICPLCGSVLDTNSSPGHTHYPNIRVRVRRYHLLLRIYLFLSIVLEALFVGLNYEYFHGTYWSLITLSAFAYGYFTMAVSLAGRIGYKAKIIWQTIFAILFVILIDWVTGFRGWSLNYVLPSGILLMDVGIILLMLCNKRNWQTYIMFEMFLILCSIIPLILWGIGSITKPLISLIAAAFSLFLFLGTIIIGDYKAREELKRRFHIK